MYVTSKGLKHGHNTNRNSFHIFAILLVLRNNRLCNEQKA